MDELIKVMSDEALLKLKSDNEGNESISKLVDGVLEGRVQEAAQAKAKAKFENGIAKLFKNLPHPEDVHNVYVRWSEEDEEIVDEGAKEEEVEVVKTPAILDKDGKIETPAVVEVVNRKPMKTIKVWKWVVQVNKSVVVGSSASGNGHTSKRAITIYKREGLVLEAKGNYADGAKACAALGLPIGGDSAPRVLAKEGYIVEPFTGELTS